MVSARLRRRLARRSERGMTILVVVMIVTLLAGVGIFAVRNSTLIDRAVGYSRQSGQTAALAELGTTAAIADFGANKAQAYVIEVEKGEEKCQANDIYINDGLPCYRLFRSDLEASTQAFSSTDLLAPTVAGTDVGSFGPVASMFGDVYVEITEVGPTGRPLAGTDVGGTGAALKFARVTLTTTGQVRPLAAGGNDTCTDQTASMATKKMMRARVVVGPI